MELFRKMPLLYRLRSRNIKLSFLIGITLITVIIICLKVANDSQIRRFSTKAVATQYECEIANVPCEYSKNFGSQFLGSRQQLVKSSGSIRQYRIERVLLKPDGRWECQVRVLRDHWGEESTAGVGRSLLWTTRKPR